MGRIAIKFLFFCDLYTMSEPQAKFNQTDIPIQENLHVEFNRQQKFTLVLLLSLLVIQIIAVASLKQWHDNMAVSNPDVEIMKAQSKMFGR